VGYPWIGEGRPGCTVVLVARRQHDGAGRLDRTTIGPRCDTLLEGLPVIRGIIEAWPDEALTS
jgi:hypothetical protein